MELSVAAYARISHEENGKYFSGVDSNSIEYQLKIIRSYCDNLKMTEYKVYKDDGYSGTDFDRPALNQLFCDINKGIVNTVIVKDLSRLGRDYLMTGYLIEKYFPEKNIRFIAINDDVDTAGTLSELLPFKNLFNDWYARDISRKIKSSKYAKAYTGQRINSIPPYGYITDMSDKAFRLIENEEISWVVKMIFEMYAAGESVNNIISKLKDEHIQTPSSYKKSSELDDVCVNWSRKTIYDILKREEYIGNTVNLRRRRISYKNHKQVNNDKDMVVKFIGTHKPIIDKNTWNKVQKRLE